MKKLALLLSIIGTFVITNPDGSQSRYSTYREPLHGAITIRSLDNINESITIEPNTMGLHNHPSGYYHTQDGGFGTYDLHPYAPLDELDDDF